MYSIQSPPLNMQLGTVPLLTLHVHMRQPSTFAQLDPRTRVTSDDESNDGTLLQRRPALAARLIWVRSVLTSVGLCLAFASMDRIAITELITVFSSRAYLIGILCWIFLKEVFGWRLRVAAGKYFMSEPSRTDGHSHVRLCCHSRRPAAFHFRQRRIRGSS